MKKSGAILFTAALSLAFNSQTASAQEIPEEARKQIVEVLGGPFIVILPKVQTDLKLDDKQKEKLDSVLLEHIQQTMKVFETIKDAKPQERGKTMQEHCRKSDTQLSEVLKDVLEAKQHERLFQLRLQQAGAFALIGEHEKFRKLEISADQRKKFQKVVQDMEKKLQALNEEAEKGGVPEEVRPKAQKLRKEHAEQVESLLTEQQKKGWRELLGKPLDLSD